MKFMKQKRNNNNNRHCNKKQLQQKIHNQLINNSVVNLSNTPLTKPTINLLSKGLKFIPTPKPTHYNKIYKSFLTYRRNMYNKYHFRDINSTTHPFKTRSKFTPPPPDNSNLIEYISHIYHDLKTQHTTQTHNKHNISPTELHTINELKSNNDIIIKPADKGGAIVIWPKENYLTEAYKQLNNTNHYQRIANDPTQDIQQQIRTLIKQSLNDKLIDDTTFKFLQPQTTTKTPTLYLLPKIHKPDIPGRPIISGCGGPTVQLSQYADSLLKPLLQNIPSYVHNTTDFLKRIFSLNHNLPTGIILITIDVKSLYTNIPNDEGIKACISMLEDYNHDDSQTEHITEILSIILNQNYFTFNNEYFLQIHGTAMGTPMAPTYANIFMAVLEKELLLNAPNGLIPLEWIRFIDDVFAIWTHGIETLNKFLDYINLIHPTIKFDYTFSHKTVNFLDTTIYLNNNNQLESDLYIKPTDRTLLLHHNSFHPHSCKKGIIFSQALRYRRIITDDQLLQKRLNNLLIILINRGYTHKTITEAFQQATIHTQLELLYKDKTLNNLMSPIFAITYNNNTTHIRQILRKHWHLIEKDPTLSILWPEAPIVAYQRNKNLKDSLVCAKLQTDTTTNN